MDPYACICLAFEKFLHGEVSESEEHLSNYRGWRRSGGFKPETEKHPYFRNLVNAALGDVCFVGVGPSFDADDAANRLQEKINKIHM